MRKLNLCLIILLSLIFIISSVSMAEYTPLPGVLSPDEVDFGGETVTIFTTRGPHRGPGEPDDIFKEGEIAEGRVEKAEELFNVKIEFDGPSGGVDHENWSSQYASRVLAGDSKNDIWGGIYNLFPLLASKGLLRSVDDLLPQEYYNNITDAAQGIQRAFQYKDQNYMLSNEDKGAAFTSFMIYNRRVIEESGVEEPLDLYRKGDWTWDVMINLAEKLTEDTNGDGEIDQWGLSLSNTNFFFGLLYTNGAVEAKVENGKYLFALDDPEMMETLNLIPKLLERNVITPFTGYVRIRDDVLAGNIAMFPSRYGVGATLDMLKDEDITLAPLPKGPAVDKHIYPVSSGFANFLPVNAEEPEKLIALQSYLYTEEIKPDLDELLADQVNTEEEFMILKEGLTSSPEQRPLTVAATGNIMRSRIMNLLENIFDGKAPEVAVDEIKDQTQTVLDDIFNE